MAQPDISKLCEELAEARREVDRWQNVVQQWRILHDRRSAEVVVAQAEAAELRAQMQSMKNAGGES